jgi:putative glutamine amidotransferase
MARPVVAITGPQRGAFGPRAMVALMVWCFGGRVLQLRPDQTPGKLKYDAVVVTGGHDVEPVLYAAEPEVEPNYDAARDRLELAVIDNALERGLPLLGICRGAQLLNVCRGGSLFQELRSRRQQTSNRWTIFPLKTLLLEDGDSLLGRLLGSRRCRINSLHNQAIDRTGEGLQVTARDLDGIIQAIEDPEAGFLVGVQWHPEFLIYLGRQRALFAGLIRQARLQMQSAGT